MRLYNTLWEKCLQIGIFRRSLQTNCKRDPRSGQHAVPHAAEEKRFSEACEVVQVAVQVAGPVLGAVAAIVTSHHVSTRIIE